MKNLKLSGCGTALITPFRNGNVDYETYVSLLDRQVKAGIHFLVPLGTTGETPCLDARERLRILELTKEHCGGRPVVVGGGTNSLAQTLDGIRNLDRFSPDAYLIVVPYYNKPTQEGMYQHFKTIAECTDLPQILYNVPGRTGSDLLPETVGRLSKIENIVGIKEATGDVSRVKKIKQLAGEGFIVLSGDDATFLDSMKEGAEGVISVTTNVAAADMAKVCQLALAGKFDEAEKINQRLMALHHDLFVESNPIPVKWACYKLGLIDEPTLRLPLTVLSEAAQPKVIKALQTAGLL